MARDPKDLISIDAPKTDFEKFLSEDNKRIFFSGPFGIGKTYFLKEFFNTWHKDQYDVYHLFPVNYQISSNENIVEFLKYDILVELLKKYPNAFEAQKVEGLKGNFKIFAAFYKDRGLGKRLLKSALDIGMSTLSLSPDPLDQVLSRLGRPLGELVGFFKDYEKFRQEYLSGDGKAIDTFLDDTGDIVATDHISHLLREKIGLLKIDGEKKRRSVLILDDFDRIDPEHTFRILNVLSTHIDGDEENKFGFDHIIIVGDIENLRSIFHHKYGAATDFSGYVDKFFTVEPYPFDNVKAITERIPGLLRLIKYEDQRLKRAIGPEGGIIRELIEEVLERALEFKAVNLRQLYKLIDHSFQEVRTGAYVQDRRSNGFDSCVQIGIKLLIAIYGTKNDFLGVLSKIRANALNPPERYKRVLYSDTASSMLRSMLPFQEVGEQKIWLDKYTVKATLFEHGSGWDINLVGEVNARFFYDTLYEYVNRL